MNKIHNYEAVNRLGLILNYELASSTLLLLSYMSGIFLTLAIVAAILFAPYLAYVLFTEKRFGWIVSFIIIVLCPIIISFLLGITEEYFSIILIVTLALFYFYCFVIRMSVREWIKEYNWAQQLEEQKREKVINQNNLNISDIMK